MFSGIEHTAIAAQDTTALCPWYCGTFGYEVVYDDKKAPPTYFVKLGSGLLEMIPAGDAPRTDRESADPGLSHLAIAVDDFDAAVSSLAARGVALKNVREASGGVKVGFLDDPEGNLAQIIFRPNPL